MKINLYDYIRINKYSYTHNFTACKMGFISKIEVYPDKTYVWLNFEEDLEPNRTTSFHAIDIEKFEKFKPTKSQLNHLNQLIVLKHKKDALEKALQQSKQEYDSLFTAIKQLGEDK